MYRRHYVDDEIARAIEKIIRKVDEKKHRVEDIHLQVEDIHPSALVLVIVVIIMSYAMVRLYKIKY